MRMLAFPAALMLGVLLYTLLPQAEMGIVRAMDALHRKIRGLIEKKTGEQSERIALAVYLLIPAAAAFILDLLHPIAAALVMAPLFPFFTLMPECFLAKHELDSGKYAKEREAYEKRVVICCEKLGERLAAQLIVPIILCAVGMPLHLGGALGWAYAALMPLEIGEPLFNRVLSFLGRMGDAVAVFLLHLCAGLFGRNPLRIGGTGTKETLMHLLGLRGENDHAPISGDISQCAFACCLCAFVLSLLLTGAGVLLV